MTQAYNPDIVAAGNGNSRGLPFLRRQDMVGVWRLAQRQSLLPSLDGLPPENLISDNNDVKNKVKEIVVRLNDDGSFNRYDGNGDATSASGTTDAISSTHTEDCDDNLSMVLARGGSWTYHEDESKLVLAPDRPKNADTRRIHDTTLSGRIVAKSTQQLVESKSLLDDEASTHVEFSSNSQGQDVGDCTPQSKDQSSMTSPEQMSNDGEDKSSSISMSDIHLSIPLGQISMGKFMYPRHHKEFFEEPMLLRETVVGTFSFYQLLGNLNTRLQQERQLSNERLNRNLDSDAGNYHKRDLYGKRFYLTSTPLPVNPQYAENDKHYDQQNALHDFRVMPIEFHSNNTFTAYGAEKILRGRYGITSGSGSDGSISNVRNRLWFQVNLFGAGRSAPGSVYSEGRGLTQEDRRGYRGLIQEYAPTRKQTDDQPTPSSPNEAKISPPKVDNNSTATASVDNNQAMLMFVEGAVFFGNDLGIRKTPSPIATFTLQEIHDEVENLSGNEAEEEDYDGADDDDDLDSDGWDNPLEDAFQ